MQVKDIMTSNPQYLFANSTIEEAAKKMQDLDTGFLPIGDKDADKIVGTITDRDIVISAIAQGKNLNSPIRDIMHKGVCYCYEDDDINDACELMQDQQIRRLIVLNKDKRLTGVISLGDISLKCDEETSGETLEAISKH
ncbi:CBS domain-containing protein [Legionella gresilensis]|uniref:CBS domain-containing protein n=1 Tax=Legionella gresilensis TaxID=91823 RepID=UPI0010412200|nr:CBS domain-containing protein [Legionella gresilensis]